MEEDRRRLPRPRSSPARPSSAGEASCLLREGSEIAASLRAHGLRSTRPRRLVLGVIARQDDHPTVEEIARRLAEQDRPVSLPTLYQNLHRFVEAGLLQSFLDSEGRLRFDANLTPHHHVCCLSCGMILDVKPGTQLDGLIACVSESLDSAVPDWVLEDARVELRGRCGSCGAFKPEFE